MSLTSTHDVVLPAGGVPLAVRVHRSVDAGTTRQPAVVCTGSWLTVKEQMADLYAARLAAQGCTAVTFDPAGFGASGGEPRQTELPSRKVADLAAVVDFVRTLSLVDADRIGVVAICASAPYALTAVSRGLPVATFASVAGWFHDLESVAAFYDGEDGVRQRLARATAASAAWSAGRGGSPAPAYAAGDDRAGMRLPMEYYADPSRGVVPTWTNQMDEMSWFHWLTYDGFAGLHGARVPSLFVHSDGAVFPEHVRRIAGELGELATVVWTDGEQTDFYDRPAQVDVAVEAVLRHLVTTGGPR